MQRGGIGEKPTVEKAVTRQMDGINRGKATMGRASTPEPRADAGRPFLVYRDIPGPDYVADLLDCVAGRQSVFQIGLMHNRETVRVPSGAWLDSRFTVNCWMRRTSGPPPARN